MPNPLTVSAYGGSALGYAGNMDQAETGINVRCRVNWLSFGPIFVKPKIAIDGRAEVRGWGSHFFPTSPGTHEVSVSFRWPGGPDPVASTTVDVADGEQVHVEYRTPAMFGLAITGKPALRVASPPPP